MNKITEFKILIVFNDEYKLDNISNGNDVIDNNKEKSDNNKKELYFDDKGSHNNKNATTLNFYYEKRIQNYFQEFNISIKFCYLKISNNVKNSFEEYIKDCTDKNDFNINCILFHLFTFKKETSNSVNINNIKDLLFRKKWFIPIVGIVDNCDIEKIKKFQKNGFETVLLNDGEYVAINIYNIMKYYKHIKDKYRLQDEIKSLRETNNSIIDTSERPTVILYEGIIIKGNQSYLKLFGYNDFNEIEDTMIWDVLDKSNFIKFKKILKEKKVDNNNSYIFKDINNVKKHCSIELDSIIYNNEPCLKMTFQPVLLNSDDNTNNINIVASEDKDSTGIINNVSNDISNDMDKNLLDNKENNIRLINWYKGFIKNDFSCNFSFTSVIPINSDFNKDIYKLKIHQNVEHKKISKAFSFLKESNDISIIYYYTNIIKEFILNKKLEKIKNKNITLWLALDLDMCLSENYKESFLNEIKSILSLYKKNIRKTLIIKNFKNINKETLMLFKEVLMPYNLHIGYHLNINMLDKSDIEKIKFVKPDVVTIKHKDTENFISTYSFNEFKNKLNEIKNINCEICIFNIEEILSMSKIYPLNIDYVQGKCISAFYDEL